MRADAHKRHVRFRGEAPRPCPVRHGARCSAAGVTGSAPGGAGVALQSGGPGRHADFLVRFRRSEDCSRVLLHHSRLLVAGAESIHFRRWHRGAYGEESLPFLKKLSFDGLPQEAWELEFLGNLVNQLGSKLVKCLKPYDRWCISVKAWLKEPN